MINDSQYKHELFKIFTYDSLDLDENKLCTTFMSQIRATKKQNQYENIIEITIQCVRECAIENLRGCSVVNIM